MQGFILPYTLKILIILTLFLSWQRSESDAHGQNYHREDTIKIMPLGNSITQGSIGQHRAPYRRFLWQKLMENQYSQIDFVGSLNHVYNGLDSGYFNDYDSDHESHWGWKASELLHGHPDPSPTTGSGKLSDWLLMNIPDVVLLHAGTNELIHFSPSDGDFRLEVLPRLLQTISEIIEEIRLSNPSVVIFVAQLIPTRREDVNERIRLFNPMVTGLCEELDRTFSRVIPVDMYEDFDPFADLYDNWHPGPSGAIKIAGKWFDYLKSYFDGTLPPFKGYPFVVRLAGVEPFIRGTEFEIYIENAISTTTLQELEGKNTVIVKNAQKNTVLFNDSIEFTDGNARLTFIIREAGIHHLVIEIPDTEHSEFLAIEVEEGFVATSNGHVSPGVRLILQGNKLRLEDLPYGTGSSELYCISGRRLVVQTYYDTNAVSMDLPHLSAGIYILKINSRQLSHSFKVVLP
jgi:acyl-CoA thioesterase I